jgi:hypothetical protein
METIVRSGRPMLGFALGDDASPSAHSNAPTVTCSPPFLTTVMTGAAVGMFTGYALQAPRWASIVAGLGAAMFLVPVRVAQLPNQ